MPRHLFGPVSRAFADDHLRAFRDRGDCLAFGPEGDVDLTADRDHLEQVLDNLVSNAIKFSPDGGAIRVSLACADDSIVLSVQDSGVGIPPGQLDAIFGLFYQAEDPVSRKTGGMGLGLYISREIVLRIWS